MQDKDAPTQVDPSLLKLSMRLDSLVKSGAVHFDPGALPPRDEPIPISHHERHSHGLPPPLSSSSAILREKQFQEELADLQRRQRERNEMEIEMLKRAYFGGGSGDSVGGSLRPDHGLHHSRDLLEKERRLGELRDSIRFDNNPLEMGRSPLGRMLTCWMCFCQVLRSVYGICVVCMSCLVRLCVLVWESVGECCIWYKLCEVAIYAVVLD